MKIELNLSQSNMDVLRRALGVEINGDDIHRRTRVLFARWRKINNSTLPGHLKGMLVALLFHVRHAEACFPCRERLAHDLSIDVRTVRHRIQLLRSLGLIKTGKRKHHREIRVLWDRIPKKSIAESTDSPTK